MLYEGDEVAAQAPKGDWDRARELEQRIDRGEPLVLDDEIRELLRTLGADVALPPDHVTERLESVEGAVELLREVRARIRDGSHAFGRALAQAWKEARAGKPDEGCVILEEYEHTQPVLWYRECARRERGRIRLWVEAQTTQG